MGTKAEIKQVEADSAYWQELCAHLPWRLHGFSRRLTATYTTDIGIVKLSGNLLADMVVPPRAYPNHHLTLTSEQRDQLVSALKEEKP